MHRVSLLSAKMVRVSISRYPIFSVKGYRFRDIPAYLHHHAAKALKQGLSSNTSTTCLAHPPAAVFWTDIDPIQFRCASSIARKAPQATTCPSRRSRQACRMSSRPWQLRHFRAAAPNRSPILPVHRPDQLPEARVPAVGQPGL